MVNSILICMLNKNRIPIFSLKKEKEITEPYFDVKHAVAN
jgi:hypothetical protein